jgi:hypothetical protein
LLILDRRAIGGRYHSQLLTRAGNGLKPDNRINPSGMLQHRPCDRTPCSSLHLDAFNAETHEQPRPDTGRTAEAHRIGVGVFSGPPANDRIERILTAAGPSLATVHTRMMNEQDRNSLASQSQQPILQRQPGIAGSLAAGRHRCREVVQNEKVHAIEMRLKGLLPFRTAEIDSSIPRAGISRARKSLMPTG